MLRPLTRALREALERSSHPWARPVAFVLRSRIILACPLPRRVGGFTSPLLPVILMNRRWLHEALPADGEMPRYRGRLCHSGACEVGQVLLHECAHQLWAIWPEWKLWLKLLLSWPPSLLRRPALAWVSRIYGAGCNSADAISEALARDVCTQTRYGAEELCYRSPLAFLHPVFRR
ncbi:hypothetical protein IT575_07735 [bacterium]|nr:hypothetical protein [bacterium]